MLNRPKPWVIVLFLVTSGAPCGAQQANAFRIGVFGDWGLYRGSNSVVDGEHAPFCAIETLLSVPAAGGGRVPTNNGVEIEADKNHNMILAYINDEIVQTDSPAIGTFAFSDGSIFNFKMTKYLVGYRYKLLDQQEEGSIMHSLTNSTHVTASIIGYATTVGINDSYDALIALGNCVNQLP